MTVETVNYISDLNASYPAEDEVGTLHEGNDHLRNLKKAIKQTFPNISGAVLATQAELNYIDGVTSPIQTQLNALSSTIIPSGTVMLFVQTAAPTGWTKSTTHNDKTLRVVSGTASSGGSYAFSTVFGRSATDATTLTTAQIPAHAHYMNFYSQTAYQGHRHYVAANAASTSPLSSVGGQVATQGSAVGDTAYTLAGTGTSATLGLSSYDVDVHQHQVAGSTETGGGSTGSHTHGCEMRVQYVDVIICTRD